MNIKLKISSWFLATLLLFSYMNTEAQVRKVTNTCIGGEVYADIDATLLPVGYAVHYLQVNAAGLIIANNATGVFTANAAGSIVEMVYQLSSGLPTFTAGTTTLADLNTADITNNRFNICWTEPYTAIACPASVVSQCADATTHLGTVIWGTNGHNVQNQHWYVLVNDVTGNIVATIDASADPTGTFSGVAPGTYNVNALNVSWGDVAGITPTLTIGNPWSNAATFVSTACNAKSITTAVDVVVNDVVAETIGGGSTICYGEDPPTFTQTTAATAPTAATATPAATLTLQWEQSTDGGTTWTPIAGATASTFNPGALTQTTNYHVVATSTLAGVSCEATSNVRTVTVIPDVTTPDAGAPQTICGGTSTATLTGTTPAASETGTWTVASQPIGAGASVNASGNVSGLSVAGAYNFVYTITSNTIPTTGVTPCSKTDNVTITVLPTATVANAGTDQVLCQNTSSTFLSANAPGAGMTGLWTVTPTGPNIQFPTSNNTNVTSGLANNTTYTFTWTISVTTPVGSGLTCPTSTNDMTVRILPNLAATSAGTNQTLCQTATLATLSAAAAPAGTVGFWTETGASNITNAAIANTGVTGLAAGGFYNYTWTVSHSTAPTVGACATATSNVSINVLNALPTSNPGSTQTLCAGATVVNLSANAPTLPGQIGTWSETGTSNVSSINNSNTTATGLTNGANYNYTWTLSNTTPVTSGVTCATSANSVNVSVLPTLPLSTIGTTPTPLCSATATTLTATAVSSPFVGTWSEITTNAGDVIANPNSATTALSGLGNNAYTYQWTITNPTLPTSGVACPTNASNVSFNIVACPPLNLGLIGNFVYLEDNDPTTPQWTQGVPGVVMVLTEAWTDLDGNGTWDVGEPFSDNNGDGIWNLYTTTTYSGVSDPFTDNNANGIYDSNDGLWFDDGDGIVELGEYLDLNGNGVYDAPEPFTDLNGDGTWSSPGTYYFIDLYPGDYNVLVIPPPGATIIGGVDNYDISLGSGQQFALQFDFALPIDLTSFNVVGECKTATVKWNVGTEENISGYEILRSQDGTNYNVIGTVASQGNTTSGHTYSFTDANAVQNQAYYRLRVVENDGTKTESEIRTLMNRCDQIASINVYPNPFTSELNYSINAVEAGEYTIRIMDIIGRVEVEKKVNLLKGSNNVTISLDNLANAVYFTGIEGMMLNSYIKISKIDK